MNNRPLIFCIQAVGAVILVASLFHGTARWIALAVAVIFELLGFVGEVRKVRGSRGT